MKKKVKRKPKPKVSGLEKSLKKLDNIISKRAELWFRRDCHIRKLNKRDRALLKVGAQIGIFLSIGLIGEALGASNG